LTPSPSQGLEQMQAVHGPCGPGNDISGIKYGELSEMAAPSFLQNFGTILEHSHYKSPSEHTSKSYENLCYYE